VEPSRVPQILECLYVSWSLDSFNCVRVFHEQLVASENQFHNARSGNCASASLSRSLAGCAVDGVSHTMRQLFRSGLAQEAVYGAMFSKDGIKGRISGF